MGSGGMADNLEYPLGFSGLFSVSAAGSATGSESGFLSESEPASGTASGPGFVSFFVAGSKMTSGTGSGRSSVRVFVAGSGRGFAFVSVVVVGAERGSSTTKTSPMPCFIVTTPVR